MASDRRLQNLLHDSELLLLNTSAIDKITFKAPSKLRRIVQQKHERLPPGESRVSNSILLNINFPDLEKTVEATKALLKFEPSAPSYDISHLSYFHLLNELNQTKPSGLDEVVRSYLDYTNLRALNEIAVESARTQQTARRVVALKLLRRWDSRIERVMDATLSSRESPVAFDPQQVNLGTPFITRKMEKVVDRHRFAYINHVYNYVQMSRAFERPRTHRAPPGRVLPPDSFEHPGRSRNGGRAIHDSLSLGESIIEEGRAPAFSKLGYSFLFRPEKARLMAGLLDELSAINTSSQEASLFLIFKELLRGLNLGPKEPSVDKRGVVLSHLNELLAQSCRVLQVEFFEQCKRQAKRRKFESGSMGGRQLEALQVIYGYIEDFVLNEGFSFEHVIIRDELGLPVWALLYFALRAGLGAELESFCDEYRGNLAHDARHLLRLYREKTTEGESNGAETRRKFEADSDSFGLTEPSDIFKRTLSSLLGGADELADGSLLSDLKDYLWFSLYKAVETQPETPHFRLLALHRKVQASEKDFLDSGEVIELAKVQLLSLMFTEALETLYKSPSSFAEAAQLAFLLEESRLAKLQRVYRKAESRRGAGASVRLPQRVLLEFANEIAQRFPVEAAAYLCAVESPPKKAALVKQFLEQSGLTPAFFNTSSDSFYLLEKLKGTMSPEAFGALLGVLGQPGELDLETSYVAFIRVLEEAGNVPELLRQIVEQEYLAVQRLRAAHPKPHTTNEGAAYLEKLFAQNSNKPAFVNSEGYNEVLLARNVRGLFSLYYERKNPKACLEVIDAQKFFEINFRALGNKLRVLYLELILLCLKVYNEYAESLRVRSISYESSVRYLRARVNLVELYFYEQAAGVHTIPERPFMSYDALEQEIRDLINRLNAAF